MMKIQLYVILFTFFLSASPDIHAQTYEITEDGVIVRPDPGCSGNAAEVHINVVSPSIIRVTATPANADVKQESLVVKNYRLPGIVWKVVEENGKVVITTSKLIVSADIFNGSIIFFDSLGNYIMEEKPGSRQMQPRSFEGKMLYETSQVFLTQENDAWYGLGQHQDGIMNYKTYQVQLFQNNTEVAVPFLVSKNNYGILWDNYSLTRFGDLRPYQQLTALKLFSRTGEEGWLTASYANDKNDPSSVVVQRAESKIDYEFLNDSKLHLPKEFKPENGKVTWEGRISSSLDGIHKLRFTYAGYFKLWIDGELKFDRWRQAWMPGSAILDLPMEKNKEYSIHIEWIPDGSESYLSAKYLPPVPEEEINSFGFLSEASGQLDYYFMHGSHMDEVISLYRQLTGKAGMLPRWAFGKWQSRERYKTQKELLDVVDEFRKRKIPLDNIVLDWSYWREAEWGSQDFDETRFPNPDSMISVLHKKYNTRFMISVWPKFYEGIPVYDSFHKKGWLYQRNVADRQRDWIAKGYVSTFYDAFNEEAQKGFWDLLNKKLYSKGVDAWWMDASEPDILSNVSPEKRKEQMTPTAMGPAAEFINAYPLQNAKGIYEGQRSIHPGKRVFILTRSAFAGMQRYAAATWSGDIASRWDDMKAQLSAGVNFSMSGLPYWTMDIGGFAVEKRYERPGEKDLEEWRELMTRWYQFGAFVPLFRVHGQFPFREIFNTAPENHPAYRSMLYYDKLRYRLLPYIYSLAGHAFHHDGTIMRGLVMDFPNDTAVYNRNDAYLFGPSLLVNPVFSYKSRNRDVYLPSGSGWYDLYSGKNFIGGQNINVDAPYERMPLFVKSGSIIPLGPDLQYTDEKKAEEITLFVYGGAEGKFELYEDEGLNYNYENGDFSVIPIHYNDEDGTLTIGDRKGSFKGMLKKRKFRIVWVDQHHVNGIDMDFKVARSVSYSGRSVTIKKK